ncbi:hypothetical protein AB0B07_33390 [Streptomyces sioyaensis]|uniref:hypothetical protein n=1 Tax=Streptomyces sioyaensis TaxID=67364 RepID=UPI0033FA6923
MTNEPCNGGLLHAYRANILQDFLFRLAQSAGDSTAEKLLEDNPDLEAIARHSNGKPASYQPTGECPLQMALRPFTA